MAVVLATLTRKGHLPRWICSAGFGGVTDLLNGERIAILIRADLALFCPGAKVEFASGREGAIATLLVHAKLGDREAKAVIRTGERSDVEAASLAICKALAD